MLDFIELGLNIKFKIKIYIISTETNNYAQWKTDQTTYTVQ